MKPKAPRTPNVKHSDQAEAQAERAQAALENQREGYGEMNPLSPSRATPDPTPHGQRPARHSERARRRDTPDRP